MTSAVAKLKGDISRLTKALAMIAKEQAEMDKLRQEERALFVKTEGDLQQGIEGVKRGLQVLNEYYGQDHEDHEAKTGVSGSVAGLLQVVESDFTQTLAEITAD